MTHKDAYLRRLGFEVVRVRPEDEYRRALTEISRGKANGCWLTQFATYGICSAGRTRAAERGAH